ncbi:MAG: DUF5683 domain-containing protein [Bacteroidales bacterium]|nr:DUF5683 domain-containing protein [Bacteroidales bacterium]
MNSIDYPIENQGFFTKFLFLFLITLLLCSPRLSAQTEKNVVRIHTTDSAMMKQHNPKIAIALSAVIPGAGQIYNKKWWKTPIIYAGLGASGYFIYFYGSQMKSFQTEYRNRMNGRIENLRPEYKHYSDENVLAMKNNFSRSMEIAIAATVIIYALNILDAAVDAHLYYFDISDDLSFSAQPYVRQNQFVKHTETGVGFKLRF